MSRIGVLFSVFAITCLPIFASADSHNTGPRKHILLDSDWRFHLGDFGENGTAAITGWRWIRADQPSRSAAEAALPAVGAESSWAVAAPHADVFQGKRGFAWYRATLPQIRRSGRVLHFEGVDDNATVYVNQKLLTHHEGWNEPFDVKVDSVWNEAGSNIVTVLVQNTDGAGGIADADVETPSQPITAGPALEKFDDRPWRRVHVPHDFVVDGSFTPTADAGHGSLPTNIGWYRRTFDVPASDRGKRVWLEFDGVYRNSSTWLNGKLLGNHKSGYIGVRYDVTDTVRYGASNTIAVRCDARAQEGWWYEGGGIYRHVWLTTTSPLHISPDGIYVTSDVHADGSAAVHVQVDIDASAAGAFTLAATISPIGTAGAAPIAAPAASITSTNGHTRANLTINVAMPRLWSITNPNLYRLDIRLEQSGKVIDECGTPFGIRSFHFDAGRGFTLNGKPVKLQGTCNHQDFAGVGIAMPDSLLEWRIRKLKEMGCNAYRMSHNPPARELLDACDRLGMLVMDENRHLGDTYRDHTPPGTGFSDLTDLRDLIVRDRNHPSIIMWSMCNEEGLQGSDEGARIFEAMKRVVTELDPTRPVTCAMNGGWGRGITLVEDLQGCNYNPNSYDSFHRSFPDKPTYGSETASAVSTRGEYVNDPVKGYVSAYDVNAPSWAQPAEVAWKAIATRPYMAGAFVWTGFDYKGEPTPYGWPCINSHFGIMDECGFPKDTYYYYQAWWSERDTVHLLPHWNWSGHEGRMIDVWCHTNADRVVLRLNGVVISTQEVPPYGHVEWKVPYTPGRLEAQGYRGLRVIGTDVVETTGPPAQIRLSTDNPTMTADGEYVSMVKVEILDDKGRLVPEANNDITFRVMGPAAVAGVGNGDPSSHEPDKSNRRRAFHGLALAVIQATDSPGNIAITAVSPGLKSGTLALKSIR